MTSPNPTVAILLPTANRPDFIHEAVASVLRQSESAWRLLLWADGPLPTNLPPDPRISIDGGGPTRGEAHSRNQLFKWWQTEHAHCDLACWLDDDDIMHPDRVGQQAAFMRKHRDIDLSFTNIGVLQGTEGILMARKGMPVRPNRVVFPERYSDDLRSFRNNIATPTAMFRPSVTAIPWDESIVTGGCDLLWIYTVVQRRLRVASLPQQLYYLRQHDGRLTTRRKTLPETVVNEDLARFNAALTRVRTGRMTA